MSKRKINTEITSCDDCPYAHRTGHFSGTYECLYTLASHKSQMCYSKPKEVTKNVNDRDCPKWCPLEEVK